MIFIFLLGDAAYDDTEWFKKAKSLGINLLTDVNMRRTDSIESFKDQERYKNALFLKSPIGQKLYKNRLSIEQLFSILKGLYNLENPRLYGKQRCYLLISLMNISRNKKESNQGSIIGISSLPF